MPTPVLVLLSGYHHHYPLRVIFFSGVKINNRRNPGSSLRSCSRTVLCNGCMVTLCPSIRFHSDLPYYDIFIVFDDGPLCIQLCWSTCLILRIFLLPGFSRWCKLSLHEQLSTNICPRTSGHRRRRLSVDERQPCLTTEQSVVGLESCLCQKHISSFILAHYLQRLACLP